MYSLLVGTSPSDPYSFFMSSVAGFLVRTSKLRCKDCINDVVINAEADINSKSLIAVKDRGGLVTPSVAVTKCTNAAETAIRQHLKTHGLVSNSFASTLTTTRSSILDRNYMCLFSCPSHSSSLVRELIGMRR